MKSEFDEKRIFEKDESEIAKLRKKTIEEQRAKKEERALEWKKTRRVLAITLVAFAVILALFGRSFVLIKRLEAEKREAQEKLEKLNQEIEELNATLELVTSPEYIENEARSQLRMIKPGEVLYVVDDEK